MAHFVYLFFYLFVYLFIYLFYLFIYLCVYVFVYLLFYLFIIRVHSKPYVELKDSDGRPDDEVAKEVFQLCDGVSNR